MRSIKSVNLGRTLWVADNDAERAQLLKDGVPEGNIYTEKEIKAMRGISVEGLKALQMVKDTFPGAAFESLGAPGCTEKRSITTAPPAVPQEATPGRTGNKAEQLSLLT